MKEVINIPTEIYNKGVEEGNKAGLSETYKSITEMLFAKLSFNFVDIEYLSGYFIFGFGDNSVVHFHIKECPDWKFGIWWSVDEFGVITGEFFAQFELAINKFKPADSIFSTKFSMKDYCEVARLISYIKDNPGIAFYEDVYYSKDITEEEGLKLMEKFKNFENIRDEVINHNNSVVYNFLMEKLISRYDGAVIDINKNRIPLYEVFVPFEGNEKYFAEPGRYDVDNDVWIEYCEITKRLEAEALEQGVVWFKPFQNIMFVTK